MKKPEPKKVTVLVVPVGKPPETREIEPTLEAMQALVGGFIQMVPYIEGVDLVCNEEGKLNGMPANRPIFGGADIAMGTFFFCRRTRGGKAASVTAADVARLRKEFA